MEPAGGRTDLTTSLMLSATSVFGSVSMTFQCHKLRVNNGINQPSGRIAPGKTTANSLLRAEGRKEWSVRRTDCLNVGDMSFPKLSFYVCITSITVKNSFKFCLIPALWLARLFVQYKNAQNEQVQNCYRVSRIFLGWQVQTSGIWCLVGPAADKRMQTLEILSIWRNAWQ
jgi:hypothetical protein